MADEIEVAETPVETPSETPAETPAESPVEEPSSNLLQDSGEDTPSGTPADWPEDWRQKLAGDDEKALKELERTPDLKTLFQRFQDAQKKIRSGSLKEMSEFPADGDEEAQKEWREQNGVPTEAEKYYESMPEGLVIGDDEKGYYDIFMETMHQKNASPDVVSGAVEAYNGILALQAEDRVKVDSEQRQQVEDYYREEWGADYRKNMNNISMYLDTLPEGLGEQIAGGRLADGTAIGNHPDAMRWIAQLAAQTNPLGTVVNATGEAAVSAIADEINSLKTMMGDRASAYWRGPEAQKNQERYRELLEAQDKMKNMG